MNRVLVNNFGPPEVLTLVEEDTPTPGPGEVRVQLTSIGMNHADLMARCGDYKLSSGNPPFTPGLEGGGIVDAVGQGVTRLESGDRVILGVAAASSKNQGEGLNGTYRSHFIVDADEAIIAPPALPDNMLGTLWLTYLTAWGCLVWKQKIKPGDTVAIPAASSGVGLAAAQIAKQAGGIPIGLTSSPEKVEIIKAMPEASFDTVIATTDDAGKGVRWHRSLLKVTDGKGVDVFFDPVAQGDYLNTEIRALAEGGTIWIYGLMGEVGPVDVSPLIRKRAAIRGWILGQVSDAGTEVLNEGYKHIIDNFADGTYTQRIAQSFRLSDVQQAHIKMERGNHVGKLILVP